MRSEFRNMTLSAQVETLVLVAVTMALCEYWTWRKVYRTERYTDLVAKVRRLQSKIKDEDASRKPGEKMSKLASDMRAKSMSLLTLRNSTGLVTSALLMFMGWWIGNRHPVGAPMAILPFYPPWPLSSWSHGDLAGPLNECSARFFYMMCLMAVRENLTKALGHGLPRGINNPIWDSAKDMEAKITKAYGLDENK